MMGLLSPVKKRIANRPKQKAFAGNLNRWWQWLSQPASAVQDSVVRRQARFLSVTILVITFLFVLSDIIGFITLPSHRLTLPVVIGYGVLGAAYALSRTKYHKVAAVITVSIFFIVTYGLIFSKTNQDPAIVLTFMLPGLLLSSILFSLWGTAILAALNIGLMLLLPLLLPDTISNYQMLSSAIGINVMVSAMVIIVIQYRNQLEAERQAELRSRERKYRHLVKFAPAGIYELDLEKMVFSDVNDVMCEYTGYTPQEFLALNPAQLLAEDRDREIFAQRMGAFPGLKQAPQVVEYKIIAKNGREFWVLLNTRLEHKDGRAVKAFAVAHDITRLKKTEDALRKLNEEVQDRVFERTAELTRTNYELVQTVDKHKQAEDELLLRNRELLSLQSAAAATASSLDIPFVLDTVTWEMVNMLNVEGCTILEWHKETQTLSVIADYGTVPWLEEDAAAITHNLNNHPLREHILTEQLARQMTISQPELDAAEAAYMQNENLKTLLLLPMIFQDRVVGLVEMKDDQVERTFSDREISLIQLLANQAASAIENARLYQRAQQEIVERQQAEAKIKASLKEKEVLLKEIHHRVKNNLQVISSLLKLQSKSIQDQETLALYQESQNRIRSMALIHEKLYRSRDLARIDFADYVRNLTAYLVRSYRRSLGPVDLRIQADNVLLGIDQAVPCGLIINELVSNALKHAFPDHNTPNPERDDSWSNRIIINLVEANGLINLSIGDNGVGFPGHIDIMNTESLGMELVNNLITQLDGSIKLKRELGTEFQIVFPNP